jgi:hypothetical protein
MRAISPIAKYSIQLVEAVPKRGMDASGTIIEYADRKPVIAEFQTSGLTDWEQLVALESFDFSGLPEGVNPLTRVSVFDTEAYVQRYPAAEQEAHLAEIDARLLQLSTIFPSEFRIVEKPAAPKPWPSYDDCEVEDREFRNEAGEVLIVDGILTMQAKTGINPETIRLYEVEHQNRAEVVEALEALEAEAAGVERDEAISVVL